jgi:hypothetical protein
MKTKSLTNASTANGVNTSGKFIIGFGIAMLMGMSAGAQNSSYDADAIPLPGGSDNAVFGLSSMLFNTGGSANATIGRYGLNMNVNGSANSACGYAALYQNDAWGNSAVGAKCLAGNMTGYENSAIGIGALNTNIMGNDNSGLGSFCNVAAPNFSNATAVGANAIVNNFDRVWLGDAIADVWTNVGYFVSDGRFKRNVDATKVKGLDFIKLLRPVVYNFDGQGFTDYVTKNMPDSLRKRYLARDFSKRYNVVQTGFIAQEVETAAQKAGYNFSGLHTPDGSTDTYGLSYYQFVVPLVKAVQEQQQMIDEQKAFNASLLQQIAEQQKAIEALSGKSTTGVNTLAPNGNYGMSQNEPNPFTLETTVKYTLPEKAANAYMAVYDLSGKQITTFAITERGSSSIVLNSDKLASGIYIYSIIADGKVIDSKRMIVAGK